MKNSVKKYRADYEARKIENGFYSRPENHATLDAIRAKHQLNFGEILEISTVKPLQRSFGCWFDTIKYSYIDQCYVYGIKGTEKKLVDCATETGYDYFLIEYRKFSNAFGRTDIRKKFLALLDEKGFYEPTVEGGYGAVRWEVRNGEITYY